MKHVFRYLVLFFFLMDWLPAAHAQTPAGSGGNGGRTVSGRVLDGDAANQGQGLPGVTVRVAGTSLGAATGADGAFSIADVPATAMQLQISFVGYRAQTLPVGEGLRITLLPETRALDEVVVTGLATSIKRSNLANSVATVSARELVGATRPVTLDAALQGKIAGAVISQTSGAPGGGLSIQLRGPSSIIQSSEPLYVIDGVYANNESYENGRSSNAFTAANERLGSQSVTTNRISDLNPDDIENIEVLKGSSAAAIYGARANAGVILITTKKGRVGQTRLSLRQDIGQTTILRKLGYEGFTPEKIRLVYTDPGRQQQELAALAAATASGRLYDYEQELFGNRGLLSNTNVNLSGGAERLRYFVSLGRADEGAIQKGLGFVRNTARLNLNTDLSKSVDASFNVSYINSENRRGFNGNNNNNVSVPWLLAFVPNYANLFPDANGVYPDNPYLSENPLALRDRAVNTEKTNRFLQSASVNWNLLRDENSSLRLSGQGGLDYTLTDQELYLPEDLQSQKNLAVGLQGASRYTKNQQLNTNLQLAAVYTRQVGAFGLTTQAGFARIASQFDSQFNQGQGLQPGLRNPATATLRTLGQFSPLNAIDRGYFAQQEANYRDRVIATLGLRADQTNRAGDPGRLQWFPKAALAVNLTNFDFILDKEAVSLLKLRAAYGETGGTIPVGSYFSPTITTQIGGLPGVVNAQILGYDAIRQERATELEVGLDAAFLNSRITLEASVYRKVVRDFLFPFSLAASTGLTQVRAFPVGDLQNQGLEIGLGFKAVDRPNFQYSEQTQFWLNRSEVTRLTVPNAPAGPGFDPYFGRNFVIQGQSPTRWFGTNADGVLTPYQESQPRFQVSFANTLTFYKKFELFFLVHVKQGGYNSALTRQAYDIAGTTRDWSNPATNPDGTATTVGALRAFPVSPDQGFIVDASYMKLREVSLYYTLPAFSRAVQRLRVGVSGNNLVLVTPYRAGYDPEVSGFGTQAVGGNQDLWNFPSARRYFFHLNLDF